MTTEDLFDEVDDIVNSIEYSHNEQIHDLVKHIRSHHFDDSFNSQYFVKQFNKMVQGAHEMWWESFGDKWFNDLTTGVGADERYDSATGVFEYEPFQETMDTFDWLMHMAKAEELLQNFLDMSNILTLELKRAKAIIEDRWVINLSGKNTREREAEMRSHEMDNSDPSAEVWRCLTACDLHFEDYTRRIKVRLKALDRYQTLGKESIRYKAALLPKMDMTWGRARLSNNSWALVSTQLTEDEDDEPDTES